MPINAKDSPYISNLSEGLSSLSPSSIQYFDEGVDNTLIYTTYILDEGVFSLVYNRRETSTEVFFFSHEEWEDL